MFRKIVFELVLLGVALGLTVEVIKSAIPYLPLIWLAIFAHYTWEFATTEAALKALAKIKAKLGVNQVIPYLFVGLFGASLFCLYWRGLTSFFAPRIAAYEAEHNVKTTEIPQKAIRRERLRNLPPWMKAQNSIDLDSATRLRLSVPADQNVVTLALGPVESHLPDRTTPDLMTRDVIELTGYKTLTFDRFHNKSHVIKAGGGRSFVVTLLEINTLVDPPEFGWSKEYVFGIEEDDSASPEPGEAVRSPSPPPVDPISVILSALRQPEGTVSFWCPVLGPDGKPNRVYIAAGPNQNLLVDTQHHIVKFVMNTTRGIAHKQMPLGTPREGRHFVSATWNREDTGLFVDGAGEGLLKQR